MARSRKRKPQRKRVGKVSYFEHHGSWWLYYRDGSEPIRRRVADDEGSAAQLAAQVNAQLAISAPTQFSFAPVSVAALRRRFLDHHEHVLRSSLGTVARYRAATKYLEDYANKSGGPKRAHEVDVDGFVRYLRSCRVSPNGHPNTAKRPLRDKGIRFILETCRSLYGYAARKRHLPPYADNPFHNTGGKRIRIEDAKEIFVFDSETEVAFFKAADDWCFAVNFTLAKTGLRPGELIHLLVEELDLEGGWLHVRNKPDLDWRIKTNRERSIPLVPELATVLRRVIGDRQAGPVFLRQRFVPSRGSLSHANRRKLRQALTKREQEMESGLGRPLQRAEFARLARCVWRDAGALKPERVRNAFIRTTKAIGLHSVTCPKSWRHTFATLLQDANVDPLIRQITLGHSPLAFDEGALGMTTRYTHTRPETQKSEIERALRLWPASLQLAFNRSQGGDL